MATNQNDKGASTEEPLEQSSKKCGIIMPISAFPNDPEYTAEHWRRVKAMIQRAARMSGYEAELVSDAEVPTFIHASIIGNIYMHDIVICDVSGLNPNVLFELGLRLAAEKPVIIINDDKTRRIFDTQIIEHFQYRMDLRYDDVEALENKIAATITRFEKLIKNDQYQSFLSQIKIPNLKLAKPSKENVELTAFLESLNQKIDRLAGSRQDTAEYSFPNDAPYAIKFYNAVHERIHHYLSLMPPSGFTEPELYANVRKAVIPIPATEKPLLAVNHAVIKFIVDKYLSSRGVRNGGQFNGNNSSE